MVISLTPYWGQPQLYVVWCLTQPGRLMAYISSRGATRKRRANLEHQCSPAICSPCFSVHSNIPLTLSKRLPPSQPQGVALPIHAPRVPLYMCPSPCIFIPVTLSVTCMVSLVLLSHRWPVPKVQLFYPVMCGHLVPCLALRWHHFSIGSVDVIRLQG